MFPEDRCKLVNDSTIGLGTDGGFPPGDNPPSLRSSEEHGGNSVRGLSSSTSQAERSNNHSGRTPQQAGAFLPFLSKGFIRRKVFLKKANL